MKRRSKAQREAAEFAALEQRLTDIYSGALGDVWGNEDENWATAEVLSRVMPVCRSLFGHQSDEFGSNHWLFSLSCLHHYDTASTAAHFLYDNGVRAGGKARG